MSLHNVINAPSHIFTGLLLITIWHGYSKGRIAHYSDFTRINAQFFPYSLNMSVD